VYEPARLRGHEIEKAKARNAAAAAAASGPRIVSKRTTLGTIKAKPAPRQAPMITIDARGRMKESSAAGKKAIGRARAIAAGR
jgi:hypothetical protein